MIIKLHNVTDSDNTINKILVDGLEISLNLKRDFNIKSPEIVLINNDVLDINSYNYLVIPELNMFYFINSVESIGNNIFKVFCHCDVLETFKSEILNSKAMYKRKLQNGDFFNGDLEFSTEKTIVKHNSNKGLDGNKSLIMTTLGA